MRLPNLKDLIPNVFKREPAPSWKEPGEFAMEPHEFQEIDSHTLYKAPSTSAPRQPNSKTPVIVGSLTELDALIKSPPHKRTPILITGELILLSDQEAPAPANYRRQPDRIVKPIFPRPDSTFTLKLWLHEALFTAIEHLDNRFYLTVDQYIQYGRKSKHRRCLVTGYSTKDNTIITTFVFNKGALISISEKNLPTIESQRFNSDYNNFIETLLKTESALSVISPLPAHPHPDVVNIGNETALKLVHFPITNGTGEQLQIKAHFLPIIITISAFGIYIAAIAIPYQQYDNTQAQFRRATATLPTNTSFGASQLRIMQQRRFLLIEQRPQENAAKLLKNVASAVARENAMIKAITINMQPSDTAPDLSFTIQTAKQTGPLLDVAKPMLGRLSGNLSLPLHITQNGYREINKDNNTLMEYTIEAELNGKLTK